MYWQCIFIGFSLWIVFYLCPVDVIVFYRVNSIVNVYPVIWISWNKIFFIVILINYSYNNSNLRSSLGFRTWLAMFIATITVTMSIAILRSVTIVPPTFWSRSRSIFWWLFLFVFQHLDFWWLHFRTENQFRVGPPLFSITCYFRYWGQAIQAHYYLLV